MRSSLIIKVFAWVAFAACIGAWTGVWFLDSAIADAAASREEERQSADQRLTRDAALARAQALIDDTAEERAQLSQLVSVDVVAAANTIESIGAASGATVKVVSANPEALSSANGAAASLHAIGLSVSAEGSFAAVMRAAALLETLPFPALVEQLDLTLVPDSGAPAKKPRWRLSEQVRLLTTAVISS